MTREGSTDRVDDVGKGVDHLDHVALYRRWPRTRIGSYVSTGYGLHSELGQYRTWARARIGSYASTGQGLGQA
eukprot:1665426-Rhodomonas_salina.2